VFLNILFISPQNGKKSDSSSWAVQTNALTMGYHVRKSTTSNWQQHKNLFLTGGKRAVDSPCSLDLDLTKKIKHFWSHWFTERLGSLCLAVSGHSTVEGWSSQRIALSLPLVRHLPDLWRTKNLQALE
jgi:hypothetical protein